MSVSTGTISAVKEATGWLFAAGLLVVAVVYSRDILELAQGGGSRPAARIEARVQPAQPQASGKQAVESADEQQSPGDGESAGEQSPAASDDAANEGAGAGDNRESNSEAGAAEPSADASSGFDRVARIEAAANGHFVTEATINGTAVEVVVDTGATGVALSYEDAEAIGISLTDADYTRESETANGRTRIAPIKLDEIRIGDVVVENVDAFVAEPGKLFGTLLGMTFLNRISRVDMRGRELVLEQ